MVCEACDLPVAAKVDDCSLWQAVRLSSDAVRRVLIDGVHTAPFSWTELVQRGGEHALVRADRHVGRTVWGKPLLVVEPTVGGGSRPGARPPVGCLPRAAGEGPARSDRGRVPTRAQRPAADRPPLPVPGRPGHVRAHLGPATSRSQPVDTRDPREAHTGCSGRRRRTASLQHSKRWQIGIRVEGALDIRSSLPS